jgi:hypothetical protein
MSDPMLLSPGTRKITPAGPHRYGPARMLPSRPGRDSRYYITSNSHSEYPYWVARAVPYIRM